MGQRRQNGAEGDKRRWKGTKVDRIGQKGTVGNGREQKGTEGVGQNGWKGAERDGMEREWDGRAPPAPLCHRSHAPALGGFFYSIPVSTGTDPKYKKTNKNQRRKQGTSRELQKSHRAGRDPPQSPPGTPGAGRHGGAPLAQGAPEPVPAVGAQFGNPSGTGMDQSEPDAESEELRRGLGAPSSSESCRKGQGCGISRDMRAAGTVGSVGDNEVPTSPMAPMG